MVVTRVTEPGTDAQAHDKDFYADLDRHKRRPGCFSCGGCLGLIVVVILLLILGAASVVAASGLATVPVLTDIFYKEDPAPRRIIEEASPNDVGTLIQTKIAAAKSSQVEVTENELTMALRQPDRQGEVLLKRGQVAIDQESAELYGQVTPGEYGQSVTVRLELVPGENGQVVLDRARVGYVDVPVKLARWLGSQIARQDIGSSSALSRYGVEGIELRSGSALVTVNPAALGEQASNALSAEAQKLLTDAGIDPAEISQQLTSDKLTELVQKLGTLPADQRFQLESAFPELKRLDQ